MNENNNLFKRFMNYFNGQSNFGKIVLILLIFGMVSCVCLVPCMGIFLNKNLPALTTTVASTSTSQPASTDMPTETQVVATKTPLPETGSITEYEIYVNGHVTNCQSFMVLWQSDSLKASQNPSLLVDETWKSEIDIYLNGMESFCGTVGDFTPIPEAATSMNKYLKLYENEILLFIESYKSGVTDFDADKIKDAIDHLQNATTYMKIATSKLKEIQ